MRRHALDSPISYYAIFLSVRYLPTSVCYWLGKMVVRVVYAFSPEDREGFAANLSVALGRAKTDPVIRKTVRQIFINYSRYLVDFFLIPQLPPHRIKQFFADIRGEAILKKALARGKGVIFLSAHIGNWEIGGSILKLLNYPLAVVSLTHNAGTTNSLVNHLRRDKGIEVIEMDPQSPFSGIEILRRLRNNEIVAMIGDKDFFGTGRRISYFGKQVLFPIGPVIMAMKSGAALIPVFVIKQPDGRYTGVLEKEISLTETGKQYEDVDANLAKTAQLFERYIRRHPDQWYCPDPIFEGTPS